MARPQRCPDCGGNLYVEPDLFESSPDLVCLQCSRRFPVPRATGGAGHRPGAQLGAAGERPGVSAAGD